MSRFEKRWSLYLVPVLLAWIVYGVVERSEPTIGDFAQRFCAGVAYETAGDMGEDVDPRWIAVDDGALGSRAVTDRRTRFSVDRARLASLAHCKTEVTRLEDGLLLERLCDVVFVVSPDWKIRAIMDEATWQAKGQQILVEILSEIAGRSTDVNDTGQKAGSCPPQKMNPPDSEDPTTAGSGDSGDGEG